MTLEELKEMIEALIPSASFSKDSKDQIIIATGLIEDEDTGELEPSDEVDENFDFSLDDDELEFEDE